MRRHDVDAIRVIALGLLIIYHILISFQPWAKVIYFIPNKQSLEHLWVLMEMINIWRIPILFVVSGMGVCFAMRRRTWVDLIRDRTVRIFVPFMFGMLFVVPIFLNIFNMYYGLDLFWFPLPGHLWFLGNIFLYVIILLPFLYYLKKEPRNAFVGVVEKLIAKPGGIIFLFSIPLFVQTLIVNPKNYPGFALDLPHGLSHGFICFFCGFLFALLAENFWSAVKNLRFITLIMAFSLYLLRTLYPDIFPTGLVSNLFLAFESTNWMLAAFGFGTTYLNKNSPLLNYSRIAVFPIYIVHLPIQFFVSSIFFPLPFPAIAKLIVLIVTTFGLSILVFELLKRLKWVGFLFGIKIEQMSPTEDRLV